MDKLKVVEELYKASEIYGLPETLDKVFGKNVSVRIGFSKIDCDKKIEEIEFSVRAINSLKRTGVFTIGEVIDAIAQDKIMQIKNLGTKTRNEIKTRLLVLGYENSTITEKKQFLLDVLERNAVA